MAFLALTAVVVAGGVALRLAMLGRQSYWIDEIYSVNESNGSLRQLMDAGSPEVHPPLYALVLWAWMKIGGSSEAWTRLLSTIIALVAVVVTYVGLRPLDLGRHVLKALDRDRKELVERQSDAVLHVENLGAIHTRCE